MKLVSRMLLAAAVVATALVVCDVAGAAVVTVGPSLTGSWEPSECGFSACVFANDDLGGTGANLTSPVAGAVVGWNVVGGTTAGTFRLRTMTPTEADVVFIFRKMSDPVTAVPTPGVQSFRTDLPIAAGDAIGLDMSETASVGLREGIGRFTEWESEVPATGPKLAAFSGLGVAGFNAEIQPAPTVSSLGSTTGPTGGGTSVTIGGTDFENTTGVTFGGTAATSFAVQSEGQLTAVAPARATAGAVDVVVTTIAGKAIAGQKFTYESPPAPPPPPPVPHCLVPKLTGKSLKVAKKALIDARCRLGTVKSLAGASPKTGEVAKQGAKPGVQLAVGSKVAVTLKPARSKPGKAGHKHRKHQKHR